MDISLNGLHSYVSILPYPGSGYPGKLYYQTYLENHHVYNVTINAVDAPNFECNNYPKGSSQVSQFGFSGNGGCGHEESPSSSPSGAAAPLNPPST